MRKFNIPLPPHDLRAVKDWQGYVWIREDQNDYEFTHQFPDADTPARLTWWELIDSGTLTECEPAIQNYYI